MKAQSTNQRTAIDLSGATAASPEFGRWRDVERIFGIKRGTLYNLLKAGKVRSVSLRKPGQKFAVRLFHLQSIREHLYSRMENQEAAAGLSSFDQTGGVR
jgi:hypothetical protein